MSWTLILMLLSAIPSAIVIGLIPMMGRWNARRWGSATGLRLDDQRGPLLLAELKRTTLVRSLGVMAGSMTATWLVFSASHTSLTSLTAAYVVLACGYAAGVVIAHQRRLIRAQINHAGAANATALNRAAVGEPISRGERALSAVAVVLAIITSTVMFFRPNGDRAWPMAIAVVGLILMPVATRLIENSPHPLTGEPQADVLWSMHIGDVRVLNAIGFAAGVIVIASGIVASFWPDKWSDYIPLFQIWPLIFVVTAPFGGSLSSSANKRRGANHPPAAPAPQTVTPPVD